MFVVSKVVEGILAVRKVAVRIFALSLLPFSTALACPDIDGLADINCDGELRVVAFGDSITAGWVNPPSGAGTCVFGEGARCEPEGGYPGRLQLLLPETMIMNRGIAGEETGEALERLGAEFNSSVAPDYTIILEGVNDHFNAFARNITLQELVDNLLEIVEASEDVGAVTLLGTLLPSENFLGNANTDPNRLYRSRMDWIDDINDAIEPFVGIDFASLGDAVIGPDGLHPDGDGYQTMALFARENLLDASEDNRPDDSDNDGIYDFAEADFGSSPQSFDTDGDGLSDGDEVFIHNTDPARADTDGDGFTDLEEVNGAGDTTAPSVTLSVQGSTSSFSPVFMVTGQVSEHVEGLSASDISLTNASISSFSAGNSSFSFRVTASSPGLVRVQLVDSEAVDVAGNEARDSNLLSLNFVPSTTTTTTTTTSTTSTTTTSTTTSSTLPPVVGEDSDGDGLSDERERELGTSVSLRDTDGDGSSDGQEVAVNSDPLDPSSELFELAPRFCSEWNGFIGQIWNIAEFTNFTGQNQQLNLNLFDQAGAAQGFQNISILPGAQTDALVHDISGWQVNGIGTVCADKDPSLAANAIDGRMLHYKFGPDFEIDYVLNFPFSDDVSGPVFAQFNTFNPVSSELFAANWLSISNSEASDLSGTLTVFAPSGVRVATESILIAGLGRRDISIHAFGANNVGLIQWVPDDSSARFKVGLNRYFYDGPTPVSEVSNAIATEARKPSSQGLISVFDTRNQMAVLEVSNTLPQFSVVPYTIYDSEGQEVAQDVVALPAYATHHLILNNVVAPSLGTIRLQGSNSRNLLVSLFQYGLDQSGIVSNIYNVSSREGLGSQLQGSYNTFLGQSCSLFLANTLDRSQVMEVEATRFDGESVVSGDSVAVAGLGVVEYDLCSRDVPNVFGVVRVTPEQGGSAAAWVVRSGANNSYRLSTPVR